MYWTIWTNIGMTIAEGGYYIHILILLTFLFVFVSGCLFASWRFSTKERAIYNTQKLIAETINETFSETQKERFVTNLIDKIELIRRY